MTINLISEKFFKIIFGYQFHLLFTIHYKTAGFVRIRAKPGKPASEEDDVMQGVKERTCELLLRPCSHTA
ncbi:MAG: hypothetical protein H6Q25_930 [Bacteroidetes bacterium]|nr:hypothetical protein [Bacteroidota bacterium]